jgi:hypothetical protein
MAEMGAAAIAAALLAAAILMNQAWVDRHFLPGFYPTHQQYSVLVLAARAVMTALAAWLTIVARPRLARFVERDPSGALSLSVSVVVAILLALGASEVALRVIVMRPSEWLWRNEEPRRQADARLGWTFGPSRAGHVEIGGRTIEYAFDAAGYRVSHQGDAVDLSRPTILFIGESMMDGEGLTWEESIPAQTGSMLGAQSANLAVNGYSSDQAFLRLQTELPRFTRPVAVVSLFVPTLVTRNMEDDRPHLGAGLVWMPAVPRWRLDRLFRLLVPYRSAAAIDAGVSLTRDVLRATDALARARGARPLILAPRFRAEPPAEQGLRQRVLGDLDALSVTVDLDPSWTIPHDGHPDARAAHAIAAAVAARLRSSS